MSLRTRIALTFLLLLTAVLTAALGAVSIANRGNAQRAVKQQLESNRRLLRAAAAGVANDSAFRDAVADQDTATLDSLLVNSNDRVNAALAILTSLDGRVIAASGLRAPAGSLVPIAALRLAGTAGSGVPSVMIDNGRLYQIVAVQVTTPLPAAWVVMGFELDADAAKGLANINGIRVSLLTRADTGWQQVVTEGESSAAPPPVMHVGAPPRRDGATEAPALDQALAQPLADARAPFERLTTMLFMIAGLSVIGFAWAAFWIARNITRPLADLTQSVDKIRLGTYDVPPSPPRGDELGVLAEGLQLMSAAVMSRDQSIRRLAYEDALTGLMNRTAFGARLGQTLSATDGAPIGVAMINLHRFRRINEHLGYSVGDAVLIRTAARLAAVPSVDTAVARLAADEFAAFTQLRNGADLRAWGESLLIALSEPVLVETQPIDISATIGLALSQGTAAAPDDLIRCADLALEQARREKRSVAIYDAARDVSARDQLSLLGELRHALEHDELRLFYQPKIELATGRVAGAEVLLRWQHPTRGLLAPGAFIPFAEQTGFIRRITRWTLDQAVAQCAEWHRAGSALPLAVNISADDLGDPQLARRVAGLLTRHQLPPSLLTLEVTESGFIDDPVSALAVLDALAALRVAISIDDFGTGYSSLSQLARMPADEVKIDRSFVHGLESDVEYAAVVRSAIDMGHSLGLKVVAEGIETEIAAQRLRAFGCDVGQGYLYAKPMPYEQLMRWLEGRQRAPVIVTPLDFDVEEVVDTLTLATH
jgi:diguanylate cyclase (GGDEF)-like protein